MASSFSVHSIRQRNKYGTVEDCFWARLKSHGIGMDMCINICMFYFKQWLLQISRRSADTTDVLCEKSSLKSFSQRFVRLLIWLLLIVYWFGRWKEMRWIFHFLVLYIESFGLGILLPIVHRFMTQITVFTAYQPRCAMLSSITHTHTRKKSNETFGKKCTNEKKTSSEERNRKAWKPHVSS